MSLDHIVNTSYNRRSLYRTPISSMVFSPTNGKMDQFCFSRMTIELVHSLRLIKKQQGSTTIFYRFCYFR